MSPRVRQPFPDVLPIFKEIYCAKDRATALAIAGPHLGGKYKVYASWGQATRCPPRRTSPAFESLLEDPLVLGSPEECYSSSVGWEKVGGDGARPAYPLDRHARRPGLDSMRLISDELLPALRKVKTAG